MSVLAPLVPMRAVKNLFGTQIPRYEFPEASACSFHPGALVVSTSGYIDECSTDPALILGVATKHGQAGTASGDKRQVIEMAMPGILFMGNLYDATSDAVTAVTDLLVAYGVLKHVSNGLWFVDKDETTNDRVVVWDFWLQDKDKIGDVGGRVIFAFDPHYCQGLAVD